MKQCNMNCIYIDTLSYRIHDNDDRDISKQRWYSKLQCNMFAFDPGIFENKVN